MISLLQIDVYRTGAVAPKGSLVQRELSAKLTEGLSNDIVFTTPPVKIKDFDHLPLHRGGFVMRCVTER